MASLSLRFLLSHLMKSVNVCHPLYQNRLQWPFIHISLLKNFSGVFSDIIANLTSLSLTERCFLSYFKNAQISSRLKRLRLDTNQPSNYRHILNLNNISKLLMFSLSISNSASRLHLFSFQLTSIHL